MAERNAGNNESVFTDQLTKFFSGIAINNTDRLDERVVKLLKGYLEQLKCLKIRSQLDQYLSSIDLCLSRMTAVKRDLDVGTLSVGYAGDLMVNSVRFVGGLIKGEERSAVAKIYLTNEPAICVEKLTEIRQLVVDCLNLHTELYLMAQDISELVENIKLLNIDIPIFEESEFASSQLWLFDKLKDNLSIITGVIIGGIAGLVVAGLVGGLFLCFGNICIALLGAGGVFAALLGIGIFSGFAWDAGTTRRNFLEKIYKFRMELESSEIQVQLKTLFSKLSNIKANTENILTNSREQVNPLSLNLIMRCYKDYRRALEEALEDSCNELTEEQLTPGLALQYSIPLRDRFKLSKPEARELILVIHKIVTRQPNDS